MYRTFVAAFVVTFLCLAMPAGAREAIMGNYHGGFTNEPWQARSLRAEIIAESAATFLAQLYVGAEGVEPVCVKVEGRLKREGAVFEGKVDLGKALGGACTVSGIVANKVFTGIFDGKGKNGEFELNRVLIESPTLGQAPPEGAIVLLDGANLDQWIALPRWRLQRDGSIKPGHSSLVSKQSFGDAEYHIEFRTPVMVNERGQARGNSGVYVEGRYEIQVLDSFGLPPYHNGCGGIYQAAEPLTNACLPPGEWQTYDITFTAPRFDANGAKTKNAELTVKHNGVLIHDKLVLEKASSGGVADTEAPEGPLMLQDHGDEVSFRNIWLKPLP